MFNAFIKLLSGVAVMSDLKSEYAKYKKISKERRNERQEQEGLVTEGKCYRKHLGCGHDLGLHTA